MNGTETLNLIEIFESVQGETSLTGLPTTFIRLAACNLRCVWCDTAYSFGRGTPWALPDILHQVAHYGQRYVCVTGGEPLLQNAVHPLMRELCDKDYIVSIETGGSLPTQTIDPRVIVILDIKCPKSGMCEKNHWQNLATLRRQDEVKFVIADRSDYDYAKGVCHSHALWGRVDSILLSPVHGVLNPQDLVKWVLEDKLPIRLNLQIHKFIWAPDTKGV